MKLRTFLVAGLAGAVALGACADASPVSVESADVLAEARPENPGSNRSPKKGEKSIATLAGDADFNILVAALEYVDANVVPSPGLVNFFATTTDQYTVFAPTDQAFLDLLAQLTAILPGTFDELSDIPPAIVLDVLQYHVVEGRRAANSVVPKRNIRTIETLLGETFAVTTDGTIEDGLTPLGVRPDAGITSPNNSASNGIVHGIDQVIVPPSVVATLTGS